MGNAGPPATGAAVPFAAATAEAGYPPLQSVPPRPQLSYTVEQQRQIVEALIADRENARYTSQVVRYRTGLSSLPPPPTPPEPAPPLDIEPAIGARDATRPERGLAEQETLVDFLNALFDEPAEPDRSGAPEALPETLDEAPDEPASPADTTDSASDKTDQAPLPPARSAVAAQLAAGPDLIADLVDETVPQMPLPPSRSALAARLAAAEQTADAAAPLPAPRPAMGGAAVPVSLPAPPPIKPILPVSAPLPPRPVERPDRSAAAPVVAHPLS